MPEISLSKNKEVALSKGIAKINAAHAEAQKIEQHAGDATKAIAKQVVKRWAAVGIPLEKLKAKIDAKNDKAQAINRTNKQWNARNPSDKQRKLLPITRWESLFEDEKSKESGGKSLLFSFSDMKARQYRKAAKYPTLATTAVIDSGKHDINTTYQALSGATSEGEAEAKALLAPADNHRALGTGENEWYTPDEWLARARQVMGSIDLDPASSSQANEVVLADQYFTADDDGLTQAWFGNVWLNPPYSQPAIEHFCIKMADEWSAGRITSAIMLTHNYTDTKWFHIASGAASAIAFTRGRIGFIGQDGSKAAPTQGQALFYYGIESHKFKEIFKAAGALVVLT